MVVDVKVDLGQLLIIVSMIGTAIATVATVRAQIAGLTKSFDILAKRLERHEEVLFGMAGDVQWVIGVVAQDGHPPRTLRTRVGDAVVARG